MTAPVTKFLFSNLLLLLCFSLKTHLDHVYALEDEEFAVKPPPQTD